MASDFCDSGSLTASARILRADNGSEVTIGNLLSSGERPLVWSLDDRERMVARQMTNVFSGDRQEAFELRLASGRQVEATIGSSFLTLGGWTRLSEFGIGARLAVPRQVSVPVDTHRMADDEVVLLAHMIGDGSCVKNQPIDYPAARVTTLRLPAPTT